MKRATFLKRLALGLLGAPAVVRTLGETSPWVSATDGVFSDVPEPVWSRISDYDGKEAYMVDYVYTFSVPRDRLHTITGIKP